MSTGWAQDRAFNPREAAEILGLPESTLRDWLAFGAAPYLSRKRGAQRRMSAADIYKAAIMARLIKAGYAIPEAAAEAWVACGGQDVDPLNVSLATVFVAQPGGGVGTVKVCSLEEAGQHVSDGDSVILIPAGHIACNVVSKAWDLYDGDIPILAMQMLAAVSR